MTAPRTEPTIEPDTKDWTWVLREPCPECGFVAADLDRGDLGRLLRDDAAGWVAVLGRPEAVERPDPTTWSPLEYACHVRDVHRVFGERLALMLDEDEPTFPNWDQDVTAVEDNYAAQDPAVVAGELTAAARVIAAHFGTVAGDQWQRTGSRSDGAHFTVESFARYFVHDPIHHLHDVTGAR